MRLLSLGTLMLASGGLFAAEAIPDGALTEGARPTVPMGSPSDPDRFARLPQLLLDDAGHVVSSPWRWDRSDWVTAGVSTALVLGTALALDHATDRAVVNHANASTDRFAKAVQNLGGAPSVFIAGGTYLVGVAFKEPEIRATGIDTLATMGIAQLLLAIPLKVATGRSRPFADQGTHHLHPFTGEQSFPSGHTLQAFALASVISEHADRPWVSCVSYGLAGLVGLARVEQRQHFLSDVVAGGLIGTFVGKAVVRFNQSRRNEASSKVTMTFAPLLQPGGYGLSLAMTF